MQKIQWKRFLAIMMAFILFVADAPAILAQASENETNMASETSVSEGDVETDISVPQAVSMEIVQQPYKSVFYYGVGDPIRESLEGLEFRMILDNGEQVEMSSWNDDDKVYGVTYSLRIIEGLGLPQAGKYEWVFENQNEELLVIPFEIVDLKENATEITIYSGELTEQKQREMFYFIPEETGNYCFSLLSDNAYNLMVRGGEGNGSNTGAI